MSPPQASPSLQDKLDASSVLCADLQILSTDLQILSTDLLALDESYLWSQEIVYDLRAMGLSRLNE